MTQPRRAPRAGNLIVCEPCRCIYCIVPKVACSNWIMLLRRLHGFEDWKVPRLLYDHEANGLTYMSHDQALASLDLDRYFKFTFVRSPFSRLLSCYRNKFDPTYGPVHPMWQTYQNAIHRRLHATERGASDPISFEDFLTFVSTQRPEDMNDHWAPQSRITDVDRFPYDLVGRLESFERDLAAVRERIGFDLEFPTQKQLGFPSTGAAARLREHYTACLVRLVAATFARDFEAFGYPTTLPASGQTTGHAA